MEIVIGIIVVFAALIIFGKIKGPPEPSSMSMEALVGRVQSEGHWIEKYKNLPYQYQQRAGIKKQYEGKQLYVLELQVECMKRVLVESGKKAEETMIPVMERSIELMKTGMSEEAAGKQASNEFVKKRDAGLANQPKSMGSDSM